MSVDAYSVAFVIIFIDLFVFGLCLCAQSISAWANRRNGLRAFCRFFPFGLSWNIFWSIALVNRFLHFIATTRIYRKENGLTQKVFDESHAQLFSLSFWLCYGLRKDVFVSFRSLHYEPRNIGRLLCVCSLFTEWSFTCSFAPFMFSLLVLSLYLLRFAVCLGCFWNS